MLSFQKETWKIQLINVLKEEKSNAVAEENDTEINSNQFCLLLTVIKGDQS